ncbi:MAG TPA: SLC13 family permease [Acidimicrobiia bacterium]|nr:SLC13 family permease [Acidimicrobiia bacterium]
MSVLAVVLLVVGLVGALTRPRGLPAWAMPATAAAIALATGVVDVAEVRAAWRPLVAPLAFVAVAVPLAASLDDVGIFRELAAFAARSRFVIGRCWILAAFVVALLNLDAAVVLLTPLYIHTALLVDVDPAALAFQPVLLASLASGVLPVSNLTNLLAASRLSLTNADFLRHLALPSVAACVAGWCAYRAMFPVRACALQDAHVPDRRALSIGLGAIAMFLVLLVAGEAFGLPAWGAALATEVALLGVTRRIPLRHVPVGTVAVAGALAVLATGVVAALPSALATLGAGGARGFATGIVASNALNNLPAVLIGLPHVTHVAAAWPLLLGVNLGPTLVLTGSLAGLLWHTSARRAGVEIPAIRYSQVGFAVGVPAMLAAAAVLWAAG